MGTLQLAAMSSMRCRMLSLSSRWSWLVLLFITFTSVIFNQDEAEAASQSWFECLSLSLFHRHSFRRRATTCAVLGCATRMRKKVVEFLMSPEPVVAGRRLAIYTEHAWAANCR
jgi:hypothetical protein